MEMPEIIEAAGGVLPLARACGVDRTTPYSWRVLPIRHVAAVAALTGIAPERLRPDLATLLRPAEPTPERG